MSEAIKRKRKRMAYVKELSRIIATTIGDFLGMSEHEEAAKHGLRMMSADQLDELRDACARVTEWIKDVQVERLAKR